MSNPHDKTVHEIGQAADKAAADSNAAEFEKAHAFLRRAAKLFPGADIAIAVMRATPPPDGLTLQPGQVTCEGEQYFSSYWPIDIVTLVAGLAVGGFSGAVKSSCHCPVCQECTAALERGVAELLGRGGTAIAGGAIT